MIAVSPVPFNTTFSGRDAYCANTYSKSILRVCAEELAQHPEVDYCPSFEMVTSGGADVYGEDNIHVVDAVVERVVETMLRAYFHDE
ncbi:MAG: GSCFA domain-containing protein [Myxococcales bacterium]|nr:GSCFA domain-containing protein [Myxococcales bacterium]